MRTQVDHLTAKRGVFYYRRRFPSPRVGEVSVSLRTRHFREAQHLARLLDPVFSKFIASAPSMTNLSEILRRELADYIERDRQRHLETPYGRPVYAYWPPDEWGVDAQADDLNAITSDLEGARSSLARRDIAGIEEWVDDLMVRYSLPSELRMELALGLAQVRVQ